MFWHFYYIFTCISYSWNIHTCIVLFSHICCNFWYYCYDVFHTSIVIFSHLLFDTYFVLRFLGCETTLWPNFIYGTALLNFLARIWGHFLNYKLLLSWRGTRSPISTFWRFSAFCSYIKVGWLNPYPALSMPLTCQTKLNCRMLV